MFRDKTLLITGGTGSFGKAVLNRFLNSDIGEIRIFSRDEKKQDDMRNSINNDKVKFYLGDVRDVESVTRSMQDVDYVFHAAALKQVPSCEFYPMEAIKTNTLGTENVLNAAITTKVKKVVVLSTDKAVYPINAMGMSKAMAERILVARARLLSCKDTTLCATRYGNVMASRGSVIPLFVDQIRQGKLVTITDPEMTRFLMSLEESVDLVLYAFKHAHQGDIFIQKAPAATVGNLAEAICRIFNVSNSIGIIGTRHGEKLFETLVSREEMAKAEDMGKYFRIPSDNRDLNYNKFFIEGEKGITNSFDYTSHNTTRLNVNEIQNLISNLDCIKEARNA